MVSDMPRGLRNRNPGNLRHNAAIRWLGEIEPDAQGFCRFDSDRHGLRAIALDIATKWARDDLRTVGGVIARYAPLAENPTGNYVVNVSAALGVKPDQAIDLSDAGTLAMFVKAVIRQECGSVPYPLDLIAIAVRDALDASSPSGNHD
jgi:hypothetical protein